MKTTKLFLLLFLALVNHLTAQTVILDILTVNGQNVAATSPINFGTSSSITVGLFTQVSLPNTPSDINPGTIKIIYQRNTGSSPNIASGGNGGNLLFFGGNDAGRNFAVSLLSSQFDNTGGILYAEYQTYSGIKYKSSNKSIIKTAVVNPPVGPTNPSNNNNAKEFVPFDGIPLLPKLLPYSVDNDGTTREYSWVYDDGVFDRVFTINGGSGRGSGRIQTSTKLVARVKITRPNGVVEYNVFQGAYPIGSTFYAIVNDIYSTGRITTQNNTINENVDLYVPLGENCPTITGSTSVIDNVTIVGYQWQKRIALRNPNYNEYINGNNIYAWQDITDAYGLTYTPENPTQVMEYRRLAITNFNSKISSNVIGVFPSIFEENRSICCYQAIYTNTVINPIFGDPVITDNNYTYQWQIARDVLVSGNVYWNNIKDANSKDYTPIRLGSSGNRPVYGNFLYRRIVIRNSDRLYFLSNTVRRDFLNTANRYNNQAANNNLEDESIIVSPNPSSSIINIQSSSNLSSFKIKIIDLTGRIIISEEHIKEDTYLLSVDISNLPVGIYNLVLENSNSSIAKKVIKN